MECSNNLRLKHKPLILEAVDAHRTGAVRYLSDGTAIINASGRQISVPTNKQFDLTPATIFGLNERLTLSATSPVMGDGKTLRDLFNDEWVKYSEKLSEAQNYVFDYGYYGYYADRNELVRFCAPFWHHVVAVASSSKLLTDAAGLLRWRQIRDIFENTTVAVAGCSVGNNIAHSVTMDIRPKNIKVADKSVYKMENLNRVRLAYWDMVNTQDKRSSPFDMSLKNKAAVVAEQLYAIDPFLNVYAYEEGIDGNTVKSFFDGGSDEPPADIVVDEVDDPRVKILLREEARRRRIPLLMFTDAGSCVQLDVLRYDKNKKLPLSFGVSDDTLNAKMEAVYDNAGNRDIFFEFINALIGTDYRQDEIKHILEGREEIPTSTIIPQLGSTAAMAGAVAAEAIARIRLGFEYPPRAIINKRTFEVKIYR